MKEMIAGVISRTGCGVLSKHQKKQNLSLTPCPCVVVVSNAEVTFLYLQELRAFLTVHDPPSLSDQQLGAEQEHERSIPRGRAAHCNVITVFNM